MLILKFKTLASGPVTGRTRKRANPNRSARQVKRHSAHAPRVAQLCAQPNVASRRSHRDSNARRQLACRNAAHHLTLGHSPDPDDAFMFYGLAKGLIPTPGFRFEHVLQDIQTLNERATRGELDVSAISIHAYAFVSGQYALLPTGASMGDGYGSCARGETESLARRNRAQENRRARRDDQRLPGAPVVARKPAKESTISSCRSMKSFARSALARRTWGSSFTRALTYEQEGLVVCEDLGAWWGRENDGLPLPLAATSFISASSLPSAEPCRAS